MNSLFKIDINRLNNPEYLDLKFLKDFFQGESDLKKYRQDFDLQSLKLQRFIIAQNLNEDRKAYLETLLRQAKCQAEKEKYLQKLRLIESNLIQKQELEDLKLKIAQLRLLIQYIEKIQCQYKTLINFSLMIKIKIAGITPVCITSENQYLRILNVPDYGLEVILENGLVYIIDFKESNAHQQSQYHTKAQLRCDDKRTWEYLTEPKLVEKNVTLFGLSYASNRRGAYNVMQNNSLDSLQRMLKFAVNDPNYGQGIREKLFKMMTKSKLIQKIHN